MMRPNEMLDFDRDVPDDTEWWKAQDDDLQREELERIETQAEAEELRHYGYWD